jgi:hypothetical protein
MKKPVLQSYKGIKTWTNETFENMRLDQSLCEHCKRQKDIIDPCPLKKYLDEISDPNGLEFITTRCRWYKQIYIL